MNLLLEIHEIFRLNCIIRYIKCIYICIFKMNYMSQLLKKRDFPLKFIRISLKIMTLILLNYKKILTVWHCMI